MWFSILFHANWMSNNVCANQDSLLFLQPKNIVEYLRQQQVAPAWGSTCPPNSFLTSLCGWPASHPQTPFLPSPSLSCLLQTFFFFQTGMIVEARLKELSPTVPVIFIKAIPVDKQDIRNSYQCPVYKTRQRGATYVWTFNLKTKENHSKWTLAGVALLLQI